eukprot:6191579-Pleurochrysis_carterae.AAC.1
MLAEATATSSSYLQTMNQRRSSGIRLDVKAVNFYIHNIVGNTKAAAAEHTIVHATEAEKQNTTETAHDAEVSKRSRVRDSQSDVSARREPQKHNENCQKEVIS